MDKKKRLIQLTEGMLLCCVIVVMTLLCIGIIKKEVKNTKGKLTETTGWYRIQDNKKVQVDLNQKIKADTQGKLVLYNDTIAQKYKGYLMTTKAAKYSVRIYAGDQLIYRYSDSNFHRNDQMKSKLSCDARIPEHGKKGTVIKIIYQNGSNGSYQLDDILVGRGDVVMGFHVQQEIVGIVMIAIMFFLSFVALITGIYLKHFKLNSARFLNIAAFLALSGIWFLSDSALAQEYTSFPALTGMISFYAFMLMSVPMVHFVKNTLKFEKYKESVVKFSKKYGVAKAAYKFGECKRTIYRWKNRYDGTLESLKDKSRRPHSHPNQHTEEELKLIKNYKRNNKDTGLVVLWIKLRQAGYTRTIQGLYHVMQRLGIYKKTPSKKKESEPKEWISGEYPGDKVQVDVKYVPKKCMSKELQERGEKFYQYTAIDEYSRLRYTWFTNAHDTYASSEFVKRMVRYFPFKVKTIQTDNGFEFTNRLSWQAFLKSKKTMFEKTLEEVGIEYKVIKPHTPKQNGRVERSHRKDQERFYYKRVFYSLEDLRNQGKEWRKEYNNFPMRPLGWLSPREFIEKYKSQEESLFTI